MLGPKLGRLVFRIAFYITFTSAGLMLFWRPRATVPLSAEFVVASVTLIVGLVFLLIIAFMVRRQVH